MPDWDAIKKEYVSTHISLSGLSAKYDVSVPLLKKKCAQEKWTELRSQKVTKKAKAMVTAVTKKEIKKASVVQSCADMSLDKLQSYIDRCGDDFDGQEFRNVATALKAFKDIKHDMTEYELREQDARIRALEMQTEKPTAEDRAVQVSFVGLEEWFNG